MSAKPPSPSDAPDAGVPHPHAGWIVALAAVIFIVALAVLKSNLGTIRWAGVWEHLAGLPLAKVLAALVFAAGSYLALTFYDFLAVRFVGSTLPWRRVAPTSFLAYAFGHSLGLSTLTGGALRWIDYRRAGLSSAQIAGVVSLCALTFGLGVTLLLDGALLLAPDTAAAILHVSPALARYLGLGLLATLAIYLALTQARHGRPLLLRNWRIESPPLSLSLRQLAVSVADLSCSAAAFYLLLPPLPELSYPGFVGIYVLAMAAAIASNVPGGLGVFESVLLLTLPAAPPASLIGAALAFRAVYYLAPFALALVGLALRESPRLLATAKRRRHRPH